MATAIYIVGLTIAGAIDPSMYTDLDPQTGKTIKALFWMFIIYDILNMRSK